LIFFPEQFICVKLKDFNKILENSLCYYSSSSYVTKLTNEEFVLEADIIDKIH